MNKYQTIGKGARNNWPYEVAVHWPGAHPGGPILLAEGSGHGAAGGNFLLSEMLDAKWDADLEICGCLWLRDLAREEQARGERFSADEIWESAQMRNLLERPIAANALHSEPPPCRKPKIPKRFTPTPNCARRSKTN